MSYNLLILESKAKCGKIEKMLGSKYKCLASLGHILELEPGLEAIDKCNNFNPKYQIISSKKALISQLRQSSKNAELVYLASDPDREGEAIAKHLQDILNIPKKKLRRITFNEITKKAIENAINNPREIDIDLYNAQTARRVLDRLYGFEISPILWKHITKGLSAGRCQSPGLEILCEREEEIDQFKSNTFYNISGELHNEDKGILNVKHPENLDNFEKCNTLLDNLLGCLFFVKNIKLSNKTSKPPPPFTTSTMQQIASSNLGMNPTTTMQVAQKLYEAGLITYMRTDSTSLSDQAKTDIVHYVKDVYGDKYVYTRNYKSKVMNSQEAHECIRPVNISDDPRSVHIEDAYHKKLYDLIWKRSVACQMADKEFTEQVLFINAEENKKLVTIFNSQTEITTFPGYYILYEKDRGQLSKFDINDTLDLKELLGEEKDTKPKPRYTEASLVKELEKSGIGRPSTFSTIINTLLTRNYIEHGKKTNETEEKIILKINKDKKEVIKQTKDKIKTSEKGKLIVTELGFRVRNFLKNNFDQLLSKNLTCDIENKLDEISNGSANWVDVVRKFYNTFHPTVLELTSLDVVKDPTHVNLIGESDKYQYVRVKTKYGWALAKKDKLNTKSKKAVYLTIYEPYYGNGETLSLDQVKCLFKFPRKLKYDDDTEISLCYGKNGFYMKCNHISMTLEEDYSNNNIPSETQLNLFKTQIRESVETSLNKEFGDYTLKSGKFGPYVQYKGKNKSVGYVKDLETIDLEFCKSIFQKKSK